MNIFLSIEIFFSPQKKQFCTTVNYLGSKERSKILKEAIDERCLWKVKILIKKYNVPLKYTCQEIFYLYRSFTLNDLKTAKFLRQQIQLRSSVQYYDALYLKRAMMTGNLGFVKFIIEGQPSLIGVNLLNCSIQTKQLEIMKYLLNELKIKPTSQESYSKRSSFSEACYFGNKKIVKELMKHIELPKKYPHKYSTPLHWAVLKGNKSIVKYLLKKTNIDPNHKDKSSKTCLEYSVINKRCSIFKILIRSKKIDLAQKFINGGNILHMITKNRSSKNKVLVESLIEVIRERELKKIKDNNDL